MESAVSARLGYYSRYKAASEFRLRRLQEELDSSVPRTQFVGLQAQLDSLTRRHREALERQTQQSLATADAAEAAVRLSSLQAELEGVKIHLQTEKERAHTLEACLETWKRQKMGQVCIYLESVI
ncbi:unnamed protein product [Protopolystoma xenopodis]|uniref:Uncharacterized protein n=1 Tax=Protopolystoma xenopodis TaxID=117903 RepID=A0A448XMC5_9PLAT|nr:unnamed protein product [Protopolystoma xenopodis]